MRTVLQLSCHLLYFVFAKTEYSIEDDWPYSDNVADACFPDPCNSQGLCDYTDGGAGYTCTCISDYTGDTCDEDKADCDDTMCENGGTCYWIYDVEACYCDTGYTGDTCSEYSAEMDDVCYNVMCGTDEQGVCEDVGGGDHMCVCSDGWSGDFCTNPVYSCTATQYMDLVQQLLILKPEYLTDCVYMSTQVWAMVPITNTIPALCDCLSAMQTYISDEFESLVCVIDHGMSLARAVEDYCPIDVTQDDIDEMLLRVSELNDDCHHFIYNRVTMPLYRQESYKCSCLLGLADTFDEALEIFNVPFSMHTASSGAIAWQNCADEAVCDFSELYDKLQDEMFQVDPQSAEWCMKSITKIAGVQTDSLGAADLSDYLCPCLGGIETKWSEGLEAFDCLHVSYSEVTLKEMMQLVCQDTAFKNTDCTYTLTEYVFQLSTYDFGGATNCLEAMKLGDQIVGTNDHFDEIFCSCYSSLSDVSGFDASYIDSCADQIGWVVPSPQSYCESYLDTSFSTATDDSLTNIIEADSEADSSEETFWMVISIILCCLLVPVFALNVYLFFFSKSSGYVAQEDAKGGEKTDGAATYETTN